MSNLIEYYVQGHTGKGYVNYIESNLHQIDKIILLQNKNPIVITAVIEQLQKCFINEKIEIIKSIESEHLVEGIIIREQSIAVLNERIYEVKNNDVKKIKLPDKLLDSSNYESKNNQDIQAKAYKHFAKGLAIHEQLEAIYINEMDFTKADLIIENLLTEIFAQVNQKENNSIIYERLFGTNTPDGIVNTVPQLIKPIHHKIFILGRAGTGKSYLMNKVLEKCIELGIDAELYRCSLDPDSIDMLIIRELNICIHDNTSPHTIISRSYDNKQIIDMYKETVNQTVEKSNENDITVLQKRYKYQMQTGIRYLQQQELTIEKSVGQVNQIKLTNMINKIIQLAQN